MDYNQNSYDEVYNEPEPQLNICGLIGTIIGAIAFCINPCYILSIAAIALGIIGLCLKDMKRALAFWAIGLGIGAIIFQVVADTLLSVFSMGLGSISYFC